jgi:hypothetical protein
LLSSVYPSSLHLRDLCHPDFQDPLLHIAWHVSPATLTGPPPGPPVLCWQGVVRDHYKELSGTASAGECGFESGGCRRMWLTYIATECQVVVRLDGTDRVRVIVPAPP